MLTFVQHWDVTHRPLYTFDNTSYYIKHDGMIHIFPGVGSARDGFSCLTEFTFFQGGEIKLLVEGVDDGEGDDEERFNIWILVVIFTRCISI